MKKHYQAVFSDIDGTLLNSQHQISPRTAQAIRRIIAQNIPFIPVSARPPKAILPYMAQLQSRQAMICYSGALILDADLKPLYSVCIEDAHLAVLEKILAKLTALSINYYAGLDWFSNDPQSPWVKQETAITGVENQGLPPSSMRVHKVLLMGEPPAIQQAEQQLKAALPQLSIHRSKDTYLEIMHQGATKSQAIRFMERHLGLNAAEVIAFGDNYNDLDMLQYAGLSVAMGNAPDDIKAVAHEVTASNDEDGIALVLEREFKP